MNKISAVNELKKVIRKLSHACGLEILRFVPEASQAARLALLLRYHCIGLVLDVGANIGQFAGSIRETGYRGRIVSFEPLSAAYQQLLKISKGDALWEIAPRTAVGEKNSEVTIHVAGNSRSSSLLPMRASHVKHAPDSAYVDAETVKLARLDSIAQQYFRHNEAVYLKIDVQGYEMKVLEGSAGILPLVKGIQLELSLTPLYEGEAGFREVLDRMQSLGYQLYAVDPAFVDNASGRMLQLDGIFFRS